MTVFTLIVFALTYVLMFAFQKIRPYVALSSAALFIIVGSIGIFPGFSYSFFNALSAVDWNVLMMITGTMGTVYFFIESRMPQLLSDIIISKVHSVKWLVVSLSLFAGIVSAFVDNVATVLMVAPVALAICKKLKISPVAPIICIAISSNLQGAATLVGDTTSILLAKAANLDFMDFFFVEGKIGMFWVTEAGALAATLIIYLLFRKENEKININDRTKIDDYFPTWMLCLTILSLILASFIPYKNNAAPGQFYKPDISNGLICLFFFLVCLVREMVKAKSTKPLKDVAGEIDFYTLGLLFGLFIVIGAITEAGIIDLIGNTLAKLSGDGSRGSVFLIYTVIVWMSVVFSAFIDNIPYTATMLPVVAVISNGLGIHPNLLYFGLLVGATLGGNITPIGASANITGLGILRKEGYEIKPQTFMKFSVPFTLAAVTTGYVMLWFIWM